MSNKIKSLDELYQLALRDIKGQQGSIVIYVANIPQVSQTNDIIGNSLQEWLPAWFKDNGLELQPNKSTQKFPDFTAIFEDDDNVEMDIKCWNADNTPAFDLANFESFYQVVYNSPDKIFAKYLVIGYKPNKHGFTIDEIYLKNMWEMTSNTPTKPINLQLKRERPYAIRPYNFSRNPDSCFEGPIAMVNAIRQAVEIYPLETELPFTPDEWYAKMVRVIKAKGYDK